MSEPMQDDPYDDETHEPDPPDVRHAVVAVIRLLRDLHIHLSDSDHEDAEDLRLRVGALRDAHVRLHTHLHRDDS